MRDPVQAMINAIERDRGGVAIVWYPDLGLRDWLVGEVESLAPAGSHPVRKVDVESALAAPASHPYSWALHSRHIVESLVRFFVESNVHMVSNESDRESRVGCGLECRKVIRIVG